MPAPAENVALVLVDLQHGFVSGDDGARRVVDDVVEFVERAGDRYAGIIASRFRNTPGSAYWRLVDDDSMRSTPDIDLVPPVARIATSVVDKDGYSSATAELLEELRRLDVGEVHLAGVDTDQCVLATLLQLFDEGFEPVLIEDLCVSTSGATCHEAGLVAARRAIGEDRVRPSSQVSGAGA